MEIVNDGHEREAPTEDTSTPPPLFQGQHCGEWRRVGWNQQWTEEAYMKTVMKTWVVSFTCEFIHKKCECVRAWLLANSKYSRPSIIRTSLIRTLDYPDSLLPSNVHVRMRRGRDRLHLVGVAIAERSAGHVCGLETARNDKRRRFYESFWRYVWSKNAVSYQGILK